MTCSDDYNVSEKDNNIGTQYSGYIDASLLGAGFEIGYLKLQNKAIHYDDTRIPAKLIPRGGDKFEKSINNSIIEPASIAIACNGLRSSFWYDVRISLWIVQLARSSLLTTFISAVRSIHAAV